MVKNCSVGGCKSLSSYVKNEELRFYTFPSHTKQPQRRTAWSRLCGRKDRTTGKPWAPRDTVKGVYICSKHFATGRPNHEECHPDFVPTLHLPSSQQKEGETNKKQERSVRRFKSQVRRSLLRDIAHQAAKNKVEDKQCMPTLGNSPDILPKAESASSTKPEDDTVMECDHIADTLPNSESESSTKPEDVTEMECALAPVPVMNLDQNTLPCDPDDAEKEETSDVDHQTNRRDTELEKLQRRLQSVEKERDVLETRNNYLLAKMNTLRFSAATIYENDHKARLYTGISWKMFIVLFNFLVQFVPTGGPICKMPNIDQFFLTLARLKHKDLFEKLADHAGIGKSTMIDYFWKWLDIMFIKCRFLIQWPDRDAIHKIIPPHFKVHFPRLTCIIDCFEIFIESPANLKARAQTYSTYKSHTTAKYLIGCNPLGAVMFLSKGFGGRASDLFIVKESGFISLNYHFPGDQILADRGFTFKKELAGVCGAELIIPHFIKGKTQFTAKEVEQSRMISSVRIHIERVIGLIKNKFGILQQTLPVQSVQSLSNEISSSDFSNLDKIVTCCAILVNLGPSIVYKEEK